MNSPLRRSAGRRTIPALLAALALGLSACSGAGGPTAVPEVEVSFGPTTTPATGDLAKAVWMLSKEPSTLDPDADSATSASTVLANICERLMQLQPDLSISGHLAQKAEWVDKATVVFTLRKDVTFHDGTPMTADDVLYSMKRHMAEGAEESDEYANVKSLEKTGSHEVTAHMLDEDAIFIQAMAGNGGIIYNRKALEAQGEAFGGPSGSDACSGPYELGSWKSGSEVVLNQAVEYWNPAKAAKTETLTFRWADENAVVNALISGEAQGAYLDSPAAAVPLQGKDNVAVSQGPATNVWSLIATERGILKDANIRKALSLVLDRQGIATAAFGSLAEPWKTPVGPGSWGYERETFETAYDALEGAPAKPSEADIAAAKQLVASSAFPNGELVIASDGSSVRNVVSNALVAAAQSIGLSAKIITVPPQQYGDFYSDETLRTSADFFSDEYYISKNDPVGFYKNGESTARVNYVGFSDPAYDALVAKAKATTDDAARAKLSIELEARWTEAMVWVPVVQTPATVALNAEVTGAPSSAAFIYYPWAADLGAAAGK
ncbi:ABC transporter substrate-binding protein [Arthrobacter sp. MYb211]|uniref:ABC transporter substrate-binding protein n=1 Tax=Micrococcaceae TaxID=1268 RepID=UPI000BB799B3|nr:MULTISPECIES: ABC transporter substrate-binding protein [Micrococcaceae]PCC27912.1 ABC transporter substrate-binding protein [Glutamicibacter sp. BW80]PRA02471.1 ABC transporter substrate-binding protein [Arthrobacter sp. MYb229]PRA13253.1 ABC transporter substrate-binding protein [Arthrobacter sp. MYb221]PRB50586.1 ABC transporter substrate-binding protein [Arthrobacter sp. MYb216]PRC10449.1 ABC transporter substrate-binding protein [Arthrobacter sp. MYb211]